jgi:CBS domain-containing protein/sporulation protein YlmC with PRC-barrel domain
LNGGTLLALFLDMARKARIPPDATMETAGKEGPIMETVTTVGQVMTPVRDIIRQDEEIRMARRRMETEAKRSLIVVDGDAPVGILEWRQMMGQSERANEMLVSDFMTRDIPLLTQDMPIDAAGERLTNVDLETLPVVDEEGHLVGEVPRSAVFRRQESTEQVSTNEPIVAGAPTVQYGSPVVQVTTGMTVNGSSGSKLGQVSDMLVGVSGQLEAIVVEHGLFGRKHKKLPADLITSVGDDQVMVTIDSPEFKALADIEQSEAS